MTSAERFFHDKLILITGASSGIGRALAVQMGVFGANVALVARRQAQLTAAVGECRRAGGVRVIGFPYDLMDLEGISGLVTLIEQSFDKSIDVLIHSAGISLLGYIEDTPIDAARQCFAVNVLAAAALIKSVVPGMKANRDGHIVLLTSGLAHRGLPTLAIYSASKAAIDRLFESVELELRPFNIKVSAVSPGLVDTPMTRNPRIFGTVPAISQPSWIRTADAAAKKIADALARRHGRIELSWRGSAARHLTYWMPKYFWRVFGKIMS